MNILEIDAVNFAGRVAHVAAAELAGLLVHGEVKPMADWYRVPGARVVTEGPEAQLSAEMVQIDADIDAMATYVVKRLCGGETLYRAFRGGDWADVAPALRMSYDLFAATVVSVSQKLLSDQRAAEDADRRRKLEVTRLKMSESIFEPEEGLGTMRPEALEAGKLAAAHKKAKDQEARVQRRLDRSRERKQKLDAEVKKASADLQKAREKVAETLVDGKPPAQPPASQPPATMSIGEAPAKPPVNRGGRGRKKKQSN